MDNKHKDTGLFLEGRIIRWCFCILFLPALTSSLVHNKKVVNFIIFHPVVAVIHCVIGLRFLLSGNFT